MQRAQAQTPSPRGPSCAQRRCTGRSRRGTHQHDACISDEVTSSLLSQLTESSGLWATSPLPGPAGPGASPVCRMRARAACKGSADRSQAGHRQQRRASRTCGSNVANGFGDVLELVDDADDVLLVEAVLFPLADVLFRSSLPLAELFAAGVGCALPLLILGLSPSECVSEGEDGASEPDPDSAADGDGDGDRDGDGRVRLRSCVPSGACAAAHRAKARRREPRRSRPSREALRGDALQGASIVQGARLRCCRERG